MRPDRRPPCPGPPPPFPASWSFGQAARRPAADGPAGLDIQVAWRRGAEADQSLLGRVARFAARAEGFRRGFLSIAVVGARVMARLHRQRLGVEGPTDVLTFDLGSDPTRGQLAGEIIVCAEVARRAVRRQGNLGSSARFAMHSAERHAAATMRELALYVVHGVLHLAGYDDVAPDGFERMHRREDVILTRAGLGPLFSRGATRRSGAPRRPS